MKVFTRYTPDLHIDAFICTDATTNCIKHTKAPCAWCLKVPSDFDWRVYLKHLREKLNEIPNSELT